MREAWEQTLLRVVQEALHNVLKHAEARSFDIALDYGAKGFWLRLRDDGKGFDVDSWNPEKPPHDSTLSSGMGLRCMRERCRRLGGELYLSSRPGAGTCIEVRVPAAPRVLQRLLVLSQRFWKGVFRAEALNGWRWARLLIPARQSPRPDAPPSRRNFKPT